MFLWVFGPSGSCVCFMESSGMGMLARFVGVFWYRCVLCGLVGVLSFGCVCMLCGFVVRLLVWVLIVGVPGCLLLVMHVGWLCVCVLLWDLLSCVVWVDVFEYVGWVVS